MADWDGLENRSTRKGTQGSNPCPSAPSEADKTRLIASIPLFSRGSSFIKEGSIVAAFISADPPVTDTCRPFPSPSWSK